jgi:hypothetical protein
MSKIKRGRVGNRIKSVQASPGWTRARGWFLFAGAGLAIGLYALLTHMPGVPGTWIQALQWTGAAWLFGLFVAVTVVTDDERRYARSGFWIRTGSGACIAAGMVAIFGIPPGGIAFAVTVGAILGATGKYWLQGL